MLQSDKDWFNEVQQTHFMDAMDLYNEALERGIAKEQARFLLPLSTRTKLYMNGTLRSWIHYLNLRCGNGTQLEHKEIADKIKQLFIQEFPNISEALKWK